MQTLVSFLQEFEVTTHAVNLEIGLKFVHTLVSFLQELVVTTHAVENEAKKIIQNEFLIIVGGFNSGGEGPNSMFQRGPL